MKSVYTLLSLLSVCFLAGTAISQTDYYVNGITGNDAWNGLSPTYTSGLNGPKATVQATVYTASPNDVMHLAECMYNESVTIDKNLTVCCPTGSAVQSLGVINNAEVSINTYLQITGTLSLSSGVVAIDWDHMLHVVNPAPNAVAITGGRINGRVCRAVAANSTGMYKFTDANTSVVPDGTQPAMEVFVQSVPELPPHINVGQVAINRYYFFYTYPGTLSATIRLAYEEQELNGIQEQNLSAYRWNNGDAHWSDWGGMINVSDNFVEVPGVTIGDWAKWTLGDATHPLPIQLASFNATVNNGQDVRLSWRTLTETNNFGFYIQQRSLSSNDYVDVPNSFVPGHGTTIEPHDYSWTHHGVAPGSYFYRLKQVDLDGTINFSEARQVEILSPTGIADVNSPVAFGLEQNYPNPFNPTTRLTFTVDETGYATLTVFDLLGKEVGRLFAGTAEAGKSYSLNFDASHLTNGTYFYKLISGSQTALRKMVLLK